MNVVYIILKSGGLSHIGCDKESCVSEMRKEDCDSDKACIEKCA